ncbi:MAG: hypothetical protein DME43_00045 [Verrucomicrobia bacterium]|nr:MAG: hypothetical protein DME43_00045 [Verrucomicrobiota bacterium]
MWSEWTANVSSHFGGFELARHRQSPRATMITATNGPAINPPRKNRPWRTLNTYPAPHWLGKPVARRP